MANLEYITVPIETEPDELSQGAFTKIEELVPGWVPHPGNFEVILIEAIATMMAEARDVASAVPVAIFRYFGQSIMGIPPKEAINSTVQTDWVFNDALGHTVPAGTSIILKDAQGEQFAFQTLSDFNVEVGKTEVKEILVESLEPGQRTAGLKGPIDLINNLFFIKEVKLNAGTPETTGGQDEESDAEYLNRLAAELSLLAPRPITIKDYSLISSNVIGVFRCLAINGYNPETKLEEQERTVTVVPIDDLGNAVSGAIQTALKEYLQERREVNFLVFVIEPTYTEVDVEVTVHGKPGVDPAVLKLDVEEAIKTFLNPANWGIGQARGGIPTWTNEPKVRRGALAAVITANVGLAYTELPLLAEHGKGLGEADVTLKGHAPLPKPGTITVKVEIP